MTFKDLKITRQYLNAIEDLGFERPTDIQIKAIPAIRSGQHVIGIAQTGTGKTAAYILPVLQRLKCAKGEVPRCIILVPTKELVLQVSEQISQLTKYTDIRHTGIYGGVGRKAQAKLIEEGMDIIVATPRRLMELYDKENLHLNKIEIMILDEADRMMDMGFMPQINTILDLVPRKKQNLLFSATFSPKVEELSWNFMDFPIKIEITPEATPVETVNQVYYSVPNILTKLHLLAHLLQDEESFHRIMIFVKSKKDVDGIAQYLGRKTNGEIRLIHSNKGQNARINSFNDFKEGNVRILITTDVMARGIDIPEVSHVVNFDVPRVSEDYVHRIGRTGRAFKTGSAITFVHKADRYYLNKIEEKIRMAVPEVYMPDTIEIMETPFEENQNMEREIDKQKRRENPDFKGAFHEKKSYKAKLNNKAKKRGNNKKKQGGYSFFKSSKKKSRTTSKHHRNKKDS